VSEVANFFLLVDKPVGITSQRCLTTLKRRFGFKKIGHHGTLDPFASGLLLVGVNEATKFFQFINDEAKTYRATIKLGARTDTLDVTGTVLEELGVPCLSAAHVLAAMAALTGEIQQIPPMYSAVKIAGKKLYELARAGETVERQARTVNILHWQLISFDQTIIVADVTVSRGTYIRVLAEQLAEKLGTIAHLTALRRLSLCGLDESFAQSFEAQVIDDSKKIIPARLIAAQTHLDLNEHQFEDIRHGRTTLTELEVDADCVTLAYQGQFFGVGILKKRHLSPVRLCHGY